jgi:sirohydrochlorin cobaltochelatase
MADENPSNQSSGFTHTDYPGGPIHTHSFDFSFLDELLPEQYQGGAEVSAAPMGAADLIYNENGEVAWDQLWQGFCNLALAGGPPHRGELLEPVAPDEIAQDVAAYEKVCAEIERGLRMITGLDVVRHRVPGWLGIVCENEAMALWLLRAIIVENISVRREGTTLYVPAGPQFTLGGEIKNVVTAVAKTHHYWKEHLKTVKTD